MRGVEVGQVDEDALQLIVYTRLSMSASGETQAAQAQGPEFPTGAAGAAAGAAAQSSPNFKITSFLIYSCFISS